MTPKDFHRTLKELNTNFDVSLDELKFAEQQFANELEQFQGFKNISALFTHFFGYTIATLQDQELLRSYLSKTQLFNHRKTIERLVHCFKGLRAAELISSQGYCFQGYTLLRNTYDELIMINGVLQHQVTFSDLAGLEKVTYQYEPQKAEKNRRAAEKIVREWTRGLNSGLTLDAIEILKKFDKNFDLEIHGGRLSEIGTWNWVIRGEDLYVSPIYSRPQAGLFMNHYLEMGWLLHRLIPLLQMPNRPFNKVWQERWNILDKCLEYSVRCQDEATKAKVGNTFADMVICKFNYTEKSTFTL